MKVVVYRAFIATGMFRQPVRLCCRCQVALVGPKLRLSVPASTQVGRLLNRFDIRIYDANIYISRGLGCVVRNNFLP